MWQSVYRLLPTAGAVCAVLFASTGTTWGQSNGGFEIKSGITVTVNEMSGATQKQPDGTEPKELFLPGYPELWVMELEFKPMRLIRMTVTDPATGERKQELIWYLVYRAIRRDYTRYFADVDRDELIRKLKDPERDPANKIDTAPPSFMTPVFTLVTTDEDNQKIYNDTILIEARDAIARREGLTLSASTEGLRPVPDLADDPSQQEIVQGVALWRNVDPRTDYFSVYITGFSNGYRMAKGPDGKTVLERKTIVQDFWRPGDAFDQEEREFRFKGTPRWIYRPEDWSLQWPGRIKTAPEQIMITRPDARPSEILELGTGNGDN